MAPTVDLLEPPSTFAEAQTLSAVNPSIPSDPQRKYQAHETLLLANLMTSHDSLAKEHLSVLTARFGNPTPTDAQETENEHIQVLRGLYQEATSTASSLPTILSSYEDVLQKDDTLLSLQKRRAALLKSMGKEKEAVEAMIDLLDVSPSDAETWAELRDTYVKHGMLEQAVYCQEEVLLTVPNSWAQNARMGELLVRSADGQAEEMLRAGLGYLLRSVELCEGYLRGWYGVKVAARRLMELKGDKETGKVEEMATRELGEALKRAASGEDDGYDADELQGVRDLLSS
ncbi:hypothetical protein K470DRAFT_210371 [Piedraia hortae CBS 480.64]|uniref:ER membrane protein complex subunit 2 n=1 Tax=Piedraia hortae CBS 480.64 TaxID=1314780 RepID=A0A6A7C9A6_9PEZI|nr:hypothetical protein K470DRAFT_210371 [Piedraia hortae CBS 480.64]